MTDLDIPIEYYLVCLLLICLIGEICFQWQRLSPYPVLAVYFTISVWYLGDILYNGIERFFNVVRPEILRDSLLQVALFLFSFRLFYGFLYHKFVANADNILSGQSSDDEKTVFHFVVTCWVLLTAIALYRVDFDFFSIAFPPLSTNQQYPWARDGVGTGFDFLISAGNYCHIAACGMLGVFIFISKNALIRRTAGLLFVIAIQCYIFQRARNLMLAVILPGFLAFLLASKFSFFFKCLGTAFLFILISAWFALVVNMRDKGESTLADFSSDEQIAAKAEVINQGRHHGLDMLLELCYINDFIDKGTYHVNWGQRYFAELAAVVPRAIWPEKPFIGIDYAIARGFGGSSNSHGVFATVATGMIGQGVVNFGPVFGPVAAAWLMALWAGILSRLWQQKDSPLRLCLCLLGLGLTFNTGRDVTLLVLFPFVFCAIAIKWFEWVFGNQSKDKNNTIL